MMFPKGGSPWAAYGSDKDFQAWCRKQPSAFSGRTQNVIFAHYRTAANSGIGMKPKFSGIPLTQEEHARPHQRGHDALAPRAWWERQVQIYLERWKNSLQQSQH